MKRSAVISDCGTYRYLLTRQIGHNAASAVFIMLNPSVADADMDDPTIRKCAGFAARWDCGEFSVLNLFAFRATDPKDMRKAIDPVGPDNKQWFRDTLQGTDAMVVCAWGAHGGYRNQDVAVTRWLREWGITPQAIAITKQGFPQHPLMLGYRDTLLPFKVRSRPIKGK
jgi:hypothetical protein